MTTRRARLLFVCSRNRWRSPTAERLFARSDRFEARSRGLSSAARRRLSAADVAWADVVFVMESEHRRRLLRAFARELGDRPLHVLDVPDEYEFGDPELEALLAAGVRDALGDEPVH